MAIVATFALRLSHVSCSVKQKRISCQCKKKKKKRGVGMYVKNIKTYGYLSLYIYAR